MGCLNDSGTGLNRLHNMRIENDRFGNVNVFRVCTFLNHEWALDAKNKSRRFSTREPAWRGLRFLTGESRAVFKNTHEIFRSGWESLFVDYIPTAYKTTPRPFGALLVVPRTLAI